jgi:hypothetical protein
MVPINIVFTGIEVFRALHKSNKSMDVQAPTEPKDTLDVSEPKEAPFVFDAEAFKYGILFPENSGKRNYGAMNPSSTATGAYQILFSQADDWLPTHGYEDIKTRKDFAKSPKAQEDYMDARINTYVGKDAADLTARYQPQLKDKWTYNVADVAALVHFMGRRGTMEYFAAIRDGREPMTVLPSHVRNLPPDEYLRRFRDGYNSYKK